MVSCEEYVRPVDVKEGYSKAHNVCATMEISGYSNPHFEFREYGGPILVMPLFVCVLIPSLLSKTPRAHTDAPVKAAQLPDAGPIFRPREEPCCNRHADNYIPWTQ